MPVHHIVYYRMKNLLLALNVVLVCAVAFLFYKVYSLQTPKTTVRNSNTDKTVIASAQNSIAYVELDSLYEHINYIKSRRKDLESEQKAIEGDWQNGMRNLQAKKDNFMKKGNSVTQQEVEQIQNELMQGQQQVEQKKEAAASKLSDKSYRFMDDVQSKMKNFLKTYNENKGYTYILTSGTGLDYMIYRDSTLNITNDVIDGMNKMFSQK